MPRKTVAKCKNLKEQSVSWSSSSTSSSSSNFITLKSDKPPVVPLVETKAPVVEVSPPAVVVVPTKEVAAPEFRRIQAFAQIVPLPETPATPVLSSTPLYVPVPLEILEQLQAPGSQRNVVLIPSTSL